MGNPHHHCNLLLVHSFLPFCSSLVTLHSHICLKGGGSRPSGPPIFSFFLTIFFFNILIFSCHNVDLHMCHIPCNLSCRALYIFSFESTFSSHIFFFFIIFTLQSPWQLYWLSPAKQSFQLWLPILQDFSYWIYFFSSCWWEAASFSSVSSFFYLIFLC